MEEKCLYVNLSETNDGSQACFSVITFTDHRSIIYVTMFVEMLVLRSSFCFTRCVRLLQGG